MITAAELNAAYRNASDLAPVPWDRLDARQRSIWEHVAAVANARPSPVPVTPAVVPAKSRGPARRMP